MTLSVLMFCPQYTPMVGGAERQAEKLARTLVKKGVRVTVLTPWLTDDTPLCEEVQGVAIRRFPLTYLSRSFPAVRGLGPASLLQIRVQVMREVSRHLKDVDVLHAHTASPVTAFAVQAARRRGVPAVCKIAATGAKSDLGEILKIGVGGRRVALSMIRNLDRWIATTDAVADSLARWSVPPNRVARIPNGVELPVLANLVEFAGTAKRFLYLGRLSTNALRDVPTLIQAFDRLASQSPDVELAIVGDGDLYDQTLSLVARCRHRDRILTPGLQPPEPWLRWADCFVLPSRWEGLSNALLEAMSYGLACIANDIPSNREVLSNGEAGVLTPVEDEHALFAAMKQLTEDPSHAGALRSAALAHARARFSIESVADRHIALYENLISGGQCD